MTPVDPPLAVRNPQRPPATATRWAVFLVVAAVVFAIARVVDHPLHDWLVNRVGTREWTAKGPLTFVVRLPGHFLLMLPTVVLLLLCHKQSWRPAGLMALAAVVAGTVVGILKGVVGRSRPGTWPGTPEWVWLRGGWYGFWHQTNVSFVSGDAAQAFVWADALGLAVPALRWPAYALAALTCCQRVAAGAHWPSDVVGGAVVGVVTVRLLLRILSGVVPLAREGPDEEPAASPTSPD